MDNSVRHNLRLIEKGIDGDCYPVLSAYFNSGRSRLKADLLIILWHMDTYKAATSAKHERKKYWAIPIRTLCQHGGSSRTWQSHIVFFATTGLLERIKPNALTLNDTMQAAYQQATEAQRSPMAFYSCKRYTRRLLSDVERIATQFREHGVNLSDIRKTDIIHLFGQATADIYYQDKRKESVEDQYITRCILQQAKIQIEQQGYALQDTVLDAVKTSMPEIAQAQGKLLHARRQIGSICQSGDLEYRRVRREDHERWGLSYGRKIIVRKN